jgi:hypothetical protein
MPFVHIVILGTENKMSQLICLIIGFICGGIITLYLFTQSR